MDRKRKLRKRGSMLCMIAAVMFVLALPLKVNAQKKESSIRVYDEKTEWKQNSTLDIFTLLNGRKRIMADAEGEYVFTVYNSADFTSTYLFTLSETNAEGIPMEYQLLNSKGEYLIGDTREWKTAETPLQYTRALLGVEEQEELHLKWRWSPEGKSYADIPDGAAYTMHLRIDGEQIDEAPEKPENPDDPKDEGDDDIQKPSDHEKPEDNGATQPPGSEETPSQNDKNEPAAPSDPPASENNDKNGQIGKQEAYVIPTEDAADTDFVNTGDASDILLYGALCLFSIGILMLVAASRKKEKHE